MDICIIMGYRDICMGDVYKFAIWDDGKQSDLFIYIMM